MGWDGVTAYAREQVRSYYAPPVQRVYVSITVWPFWLLSFSVLAAFLGVTIWSNVNAQTCTQQLSYSTWTAATSCQVFDSAFGEWVWPVSIPQYIDPEILTEGITVTPDVVEVNDAVLWAPTQCTNLRPTGFIEVVLNMTVIPDDSTQLVVSVDAWVDNSPPFRFVVVALTPSTFVSSSIQKLPGLVVLRSDPAAAQPIVLESSFTFTAPTQTQLYIYEYYTSLASVIGVAMQDSCDAFIDKRHLQQCEQCVSDSKATVAYIILLAFVSAVQTLLGITMLVVQWWNRHRLESNQPPSTPARQQPLPLPPRPQKMLSGTSTDTTTSPSSLVGDEMC